MAVTVTPADPQPHPLLSQDDSGKESMTCSDASGHSICSETAHLIKLDSPDYPLARNIDSSMASIAAQFDPVPLVGSLGCGSRDSGVGGSGGGMRECGPSPTPTPPAHQQYFSPQLQYQYSYQQPQQQPPQQQQCLQHYSSLEGMSDMWMDPGTYQRERSFSSTSPKGKRAVVLYFC